MRLGWKKLSILGVSLLLCYSWSLRVLTYNKSCYSSLLSVSVGIKTNNYKLFLLEVVWEIYQSSMISNVKLCLCWIIMVGKGHRTLHVCLRRDEEVLC